MRVALGLAVAGGSTAALNWGWVAQHTAASALPRLSLRRPIAALRILFREPAWLGGFAAGVGGWVLYVAALALAPLSLVQAVSAGGVGLLALFAQGSSGRSLTRRELVGVAAAIGGLATLGLSLWGGSDAGRHGAWIAVALWLACSLVAAAIVAGPLAFAVAAGAGLGLAAGILYGAGDVGTKAAVAGGWWLLFVPALLACHGLAFICIQLGFQRGDALATAGTASLLTNSLPILAGIVLFHERLPTGPLAAVRVLAFACVVAGAASLARAS